MRLSFVHGGFGHINSKLDVADSGFGIGIGDLSIANLELGIVNNRLVVVISGFGVFIGRCCTDSSTGRLAIGIVRLGLDVIHGGERTISEWVIGGTGRAGRTAACCCGYGTDYGTYNCQ